MFLTPNWQVPDHIHGLVTTVEMGNLALHAGDTSATLADRARLRHLCDLPQEPVWLEQVHGSDVVEIDRCPVDVPKVDAAYTTTADLPLVVMTADCLPILVTDASGEEIAVIHAGWRGLAAGVIANALARFKSRALVAWIGPAIGPCHYEVDEPVRRCFRESLGFSKSVTEGRWMMDLAGIAADQLERGGVQTVSGCGICTYCDTAFYSHRRDPRSGRMAAILWKTSFG